MSGTRRQMKRPILDHDSKQSRLFILRLWFDLYKPDQEQRIYGQIRQAPEGDSIYFRDWEQLIRFLEQQMESS